MAAPAPASASKPSTASYEATAVALSSLTEHSGTELAADPKTALHQPAEAGHASAHPWLRRLFGDRDIAKYEEDFFASHKYGNYVVDRATGARTFESMSIYVRLGMHLLYYGSQQEKLLQWDRTEDLLKAQSVKMGEAYDAPESVSHIQPFIESFGLQDSLSEMKEPDPTKYPTFNAFFAREIRPEARPVAEPGNDMVISSPADCRLTAYQTVDLATKYWIKGFGFTLARLFADEALAQSFEGGSIAIARLAPQDYHRWHAPTSGTVESVREIPGTYYTVNPQAINQSGTLDVFCENRRSVMVLKRKGTGSRIAVVAVGAMLVGSIKYVDGVDSPGAEVARGQCLGAFYYGGSTVIVVCPKGEMVVDSDLAHNSSDQQVETLVKVGWRIGEKK